MSKQFEEVDWEHLHSAMKNKADMYNIWRYKQTSGFCGMRVKLGSTWEKNPQTNNAPIAAPGKLTLT
jgi:hypothetical protein